VTPRSLFLIVIVVVVNVVDSVGLRSVYNMHGFHRSVPRRLCPPDSSECVRFPRWSRDGATHARHLHTIYKQLGMCEHTDNSNTYRMQVFNL